MKEDEEEEDEEEGEQRREHWSDSIADMMILVQEWQSLVQTPRPARAEMRRLSVWA
jgi:hypothetical protein